MQKGVHVGALSFVTIFSITALVTTAFFIYYANEWNNTEDIDKDDNFTKAEISYQATVVLLVMILSGMHGFVVLYDLV